MAAVGHIPCAVPDVNELRSGVVAEEAPQSLGSRTCSSL